MGYPMPPRTPTMDVNNMNRRVYTRQELVAMPTNEFRMLEMCLSARAFGLLGISYKTSVTMYQDPRDGSIILEWI